MSEKLKFNRRNHTVGLATVHLVWIPKRRRKVLIGDVKKRLLEIFAEVAKDNSFVIRSQEVAPDHVHLLIEYSSRDSIAQVVQAFKGRSSRLLRKEFPELLKLPSLWSRSYFYETTGKVSSEKIRAYIEDPHHY
ncbi:IS200/IS605 family transposase [Crocosphaera chwakensis]|uniref:Transposase n=1 Tax=Crocosphaera chwakensis CCY0110 TaxID=391612 RepID=A3ITV5_9CHRO|nr:IS200/IS605 family transposase [Crocosphaera chwakensis]EAZ90050.1 transposase [Crocosphaera chwakensis CCY0110]